MMSPMGASSLFDRILNILYALAAIIIIGMVFLICSEVFARYVLEIPHAYVQELIEYSILYMTFLATAWVLRNDGHVRMDLFYNFLSPRNQFMLDMVTSLLCALTCLIVGYYGVLLVWHLFQEGVALWSVLEPPKWLILLVIPLGNLLLFVQFLRRTLASYRRWQKLSKKR